jgi:hypothetical protein
LQTQVRALSNVTIDPARIADEIEACLAFLGRFFRLLMAFGALGSANISYLETREGSWLYVVGDGVHFDRLGEVL